MTSTKIANLAASLEASYKANKARYPHLDTICIDLIGNYPADADMNTLSAFMSSSWVISVKRYNASPDDSGCVWMTPRSGS